MPDRAPFAFLRSPYLLCFGVYLAVMIVLDVDISYGSYSAYALKIRWPVLGAMAGLGIILLFARGLGRLSLSHLALALLILVMAASALYAPDPSYTFQRAVSIGLLFAATMIGLFCYLRTTKEALAFNDLYWCLATGVVVVGFLLTRGNVASNGRYEGIHSAATGAGGFAAMFLPIAIYQVRFRLSRSWQVIGWLIVALVGLQLLLSGARTALAISLVTCTAIGLVYFGRRILYAAIPLAVVIPSVLILDDDFVSRMAKRSQMLLRAESINNLTGRKERWEFGVEKFREQPILGHGFGVSRWIAEKEAAEFNAGSGVQTTLHSDHVELLVDLGLVGWSLFALFWVGIGLSGLKMLRIDDERRMLALAYLASASYLFTDTFMHGAFFAAGNGFASYTWSLLATAAAIAAMPATISTTATSSAQATPGALPARSADRFEPPSSRVQRILMETSPGGKKTRSPRRTPPPIRRVLASIHQDSNGK